MVLSSPRGHPVPLDAMEAAGKCSLGLVGFTPGLALAQNSLGHMAGALRGTRRFQERGSPGSIGASGLRWALRRMGWSSAEGKGSQRLHRSPGLAQGHPLA